MFENTVWGVLTMDIEGVDDTLPFTIGVKGPNGIMYPLVKKGSKLPVSYKQKFAKMGSEDLDASFFLVIGERPFVELDEPICVLTIKEGTIRTAEPPRFELSIDIARGGEMDLSALCVNEDFRRFANVLYNSKTIAKSQIDRVEADAEAHAEEDAAILKTYERMQEINKRIVQVRGEMWPEVRRHFGFKNGRGYKRCYSAIVAILGQGPAAMDAARTADLERLFAEHEQWAARIESEFERVQAMRENRVDIGKGSKSDEE